MAGLGGIVELALGADKPAAVDVGTAFVIKELTGQMRELSLNGRGLPYRPLTLESTQRVKLTWLPGYSVATATVLGAAEEPTTIHGYWKERFIGKAPGDGPQSVLGKVAGALQSVSASLTGGFGAKSAAGDSSPISLDGKSIDTVAEAVAKVDEIRAQGQLLEVTWGQQVRHGHLTRFKQEWHNTRDCEWDMTFEWISRGEAHAAAVHALDVTAKDTKALLQAGLDDVLAIMAELPAIASELQDLVTSQLQKIDSVVSAVGDAVLAVDDIASLPSDTARRVVGLLTTVEAQIDSLAETIAERPAPAWHRDAQQATRVEGTMTFLEADAAGLETGSGGVERIGQTDRVKMAEFAARMNDGLRAMKQTATERRVKIGAQVGSDIVGTFTAREGDDLRDAAFQFYGDAFEWRRIMLFNGLSSAELAAGQIVLVPRIAPSGEAGDFR